MSDTGANEARQASDEVREEVKLDLDEGSVKDYEAVRSDYATDPDSEMAHPATVDHGDEFDNDELVEEEDRDQEEDDWAPRRDEEE